VITLYYKRAVSFLYFISTLTLIIGQNTNSYRYDYSWNDSISQYAIPEKYSEEDQVIVFENSFSELVDVNGNLMLESWFHTKIYLNSDKAIEDNNKLYIPIAQDGKLFEHKVRLIYPSGIVKEIGTEDILEGVHAESQTKYAYYALEELEKGVEIEYMYQRRGTAYFFGYVNYLERDCPLLSFNWEMVIPNYLVFSFRSYNGLKNVDLEDIDENRYRAKILVENVAKFEYEPLAYGKSNKQYFIYKIDEHRGSGRKNINSFGPVSESFHKRTIVPNDKRINRLLKKEFKSIDVNLESDPRERALKIENYIKENFAFIERRDKDLEDLGTILKNRSFDDLGAISLYFNLLKMAELEPQVVSTSSRGKVRFDPTFENHLFLDKVFLKLESLDLFIDPSDAMSRLSFIDPLYLGHEGLVINELKIQGIETPIAKIEKFKPTRAMDNLIKSKITMGIGDDFEEVEIMVDRKLFGLSAKPFQGLYDFVQEDKMDEYKKYILQYYGEHSQLSDTKFFNLGGEFIAREPVHFIVEMSGEPFLEYAGDKVILKVGSLIGPQSQLYQEDSISRKYSIGTIQPKRYEYEINIDIPKGYEIKGLEDLMIDKGIQDEDYEVYFKSRYKREGSKISILIEENYNLSEYPASFFPIYQKVINAAADFNKVKLICTRI